MSLTPHLLERDPRRSNVVTRIEGTDPSAPALLVHIHLDVVPTDPSTWNRASPDAGEIRDGHVWGRGAVDMKNMAAMDADFAPRPPCRGAGDLAATSSSRSSPMRNWAGVPAPE